MPVFALYEFNDTDTLARDSAPANGEQNGYYANGAQGGPAGVVTLDGVDDLVKIYSDPVFQMDRGTLGIRFTQEEQVGDGANTVLSRDTQGLGEGGGFRLQVQPDGRVTISHETADDTEVFGTEAGFANPGDDIEVTYSWDFGGDAPGRALIVNHTTGATHSEDVPNTLTMNMPELNQHWMVGVGQSQTTPEAPLSGHDQHFKGTVEYFSLSDTKDNLPGNTDPVANPDSATTTAGEPVTLSPLANDTDADGDTLSIIGTPTSPDGTIVVNPDGSVTFTPNAGFLGQTTFEYQIGDGNGGTATSTITITVNPATERDGIVRGTPGDDLIDADYVDPWDGDMVDNEDALIPGDAPNDDRIVAGGGNDTIYAGLGNDSVWAGPGNDIVYGGEGDDSVWAGPGDDLVYGGNGNDRVYGGVGDDTLYGDAGDDTLYGGTGNDEIYGGDGDDVLYGGAGDDTIISGEGNDTVYGGAGDDLIDTRGNGIPLPDIDYPGFYEADPDPNDNRDLVYGGHGNDTIYTGDDADTIFGGMGDDYIDAGVDADLVYAGQGNDTVIGGEGADTIYGGMGDDVLYGGLGPVGGDVLDIPDDRDLRPENNTDLIYGGHGNDTIYGRDDNDTLFGGMGDDLIYGGVDDDLVYGGQGDDTLHGDQGDDTLFGGMGNDLIHGGDDDDLVYGGQGDDTLHGDAGNDTLYGGLGHDVLYGGAGQDLLYGGAGNDTIYGGAGASRIYGGADRDLIIIDSQEAGIGTFVDGNEGGDDWDTLDLSGAGPLSIVYDSDNPENGTVTFFDADGNPAGTLRFINIENVVPCFTPGTLIATPRGEIPVEELREGDRVITRDNGIQQIRWTGFRDLNAAEFNAAPHLRPVMIRKGSLGNGLPERDMMVSPNHRVLVANDRTALYFDEHEVLVAAKHLVGAEGITSVQSSGTSYIHFMCDRHEVVLSNGAWTETFQPGDQTLRGMGNAQRTEIFELFPELKTPAGVDAYVAARKTLKRHEAALLVK